MLISSLALMIILNVCSSYLTFKRIYVSKIQSISLSSRKNLNASSLYCDSGRGVIPELFGKLTTPAITQEKLLKNINDLNRERYTVWPNFLTDEDLAEICLDLDKRYANGDMQDAAIKGSVSSFGSVSYGDAQRREVRTAIRSTSTVWLNYITPNSSTESKLLQYLDAFRMQLGEALQCEFDFSDTEVLYARYPVGGFYKKHADSHSTLGNGVQLQDTERALSFILYLNQNEWSEEHGGELRMYGPEAIPWVNYVDVPPEPGSLLLFKSPDFLHEVLATTVVRRAVVGWFRISTKAAIVVYYSSLLDKYL